MKIHSNTTQVDSTQFGARNVNDASMLATARGLAQKNIAPSPLLLTQLAVNAQIEALQQQKTSWASSSSSSGNSPIDTHIVALQTLKNRGFQSAPNAELTIPLSGKGLGGAPTRRNLAARREELQAEIQEQQNFVGSARQQIHLTETETLPELRVLFHDAEPGSTERQELFQEIEQSSRLVIELRIQVSGLLSQIAAKTAELRRLGG